MSLPRSRIALGWVRHRRHTPRRHAFAYRVGMPLLDLDEAPALLAGHPLWGWQRRAWLSVRREDFLPGDETDLAEAARRRHAERTGCYLPGRVELLAQPRWLGYCFNPIALFFLHDAQGRLAGMLAEVRSTPWGERICYAMPVPAGATRWRHRNAKAMHVSPFMPMDMEYHWRCRRDSQRLTVHIENHRDGIRVFDATLHLELRPASRWQMTALPLRHPWMTGKTQLAIHFEALRLYLKRVPYVPHPDSISRPQTR